MTTRVAVVGSREFKDFGALEEVLDALLFRKEVSKPVIILSGGARGADSLAKRYARKHGLKFRVFLADWDTYRKAAGPIRNKIMAEKADLVVAFWDGESKGTSNMIQVSTANHKPVVIFNFVTKKTQKV